MRYFQLNNSRGDIALYLVLIFVILGAAALTGSIFGKEIKILHEEKVTATLEDPQAASAKKSLQLRSLKPITPSPSPVSTVPPTVIPPTTPPPTPSPTGGCPHYQPITNNCICTSGAIYLYCDGRVPFDAPDCTIPPSGDRTLCDSIQRQNPTCVYYCMGKPVIYLYPEQTTFIDVKLTIPGIIYISIPDYPRQGWENIEAHPDGKLIYRGKQYPNLYYESQVERVNVPKNGVFIKTSDLQEELIKITYALGLNKTEQEEFLDYWLPKLYDLKSPYILFSLFAQSEKDRIDHVDISPKPKTFIEFLAYFKAIDKPYQIPELKLPQEPPERHGFTAVEWGGTIEP